jgi:hypothetical protein
MAKQVIERCKIVILLQLLQIRQALDGLEKLDTISNEFMPSKDITDADALLLDSYAFWDNVLMAR